MASEWECMAFELLARLGDDVADTRKMASCVHAHLRCLLPGGAGVPARGPELRSWRRRWKFGRVTKFEMNAFRTTGQWLAADEAFA